MTRGLLALALLLVALVGCGDDDSGADGPANATVADVAGGRVPAGEEVRLEGRAYPIGEAGFVLVGNGAGVFVDFVPSEVQKVEPGEPVQIEGDVGRQDGGTAIQLESQLERDDIQGVQGPVVAEALLAAPVGRGEPYVEGVGLHGEGNALTRSG